MFLLKRASPVTHTFLLIIILASASCKTVKNIPVNRPYVAETNINIQDNFSTDKKDLTLQLQGQLHDSLQTRVLNKFLLFQTLTNPAAFDSTYADQSIVFMRALLQSMGYYRDTISYNYKIDSIAAGNFPTTINFNVNTGRITRIDSISYNIVSDTLEYSDKYLRALDTLQLLTINSLNETLVKKGDPFSKYTLSAERDRLADVYRNNGYLRYSQEEMLVLWDTVGIALIRPTLDPIEQAAQLAELRRRRANPTADVEFRLRETPDTTRITRYYIGNVTVFPDLTADTTDARTSEVVNGYRFVSYRDLFRADKLTDYIFLRRGDLYRQNKYLQTQNKFSSLGAWRFVNIVQLPRDGQDSVDIEIRLTPSKKYGFNANLEGSRNQGNLSIAEGNLIGLGITVGLQNRNFGRAANQSITNFRFGTELNATTRNLIQTRQLALNHSIQFPRLVPKIKWLYNPEADNEVRTIFSLNAANTDRRRYYNLTTLNTSWGFEKSWKNKLLGIRLPNIEYNLLARRNLLDSLIQNNKSYRYIFNTGFIISSVLNFSIAGGGKNITRLTSSSIEFPLIPFQIRDDLYRFIKLDAEYRQTHKIRRTTFAWRVFGGVGYGMPFSNLDSLNFYLPFFRAYYAGGPNSMRAWGVRKLGPGSSIRSFARTDAPDRFGDLRLEANAEYRFYLASFNGIIINSAVFTDIGNVWFLRENLDFPGGEFRLNKLGKDIAIGLGTGLRLDFGFLKVRFDYSYKVKDPTPENIQDQNKWFHNWQLRNGQFQLGIDYPF